MAFKWTKKQYAAAGGTFAVALAIGTAMQYGGAVADRFISEEAKAAPDEILPSDAVIIPVAANMAVPTTFELPTVTLPIHQAANFETTFDEIKAPSMTLPSLNTIATTNADTLMLDVIDSTLNPEAEIALLEQAAAFCEATMSATSGDLAMVTLKVVNPCRPNAVIAIHHQGMMFDVITDETGTAEVDVPALAQEAFFVAAFDDGDGAVAMTDVPSLAMYDRAVVQWQGDSQVELHAFEFGATYEEPGHVWSKATSSLERVSNGTGGYLTSLGDASAENALMAEVYTFPSGISLQDGDVKLRIEAEVTQRNCGREIEAQGIQLIPEQEVASVDMVVTMPDCDAVGEYILLKNMYQDLKFASK